MDRLGFMGNCCGRDGYEYTSSDGGEILLCANTADGSICKKHKKKLIADGMGDEIVNYARELTEHFNRYVGQRRYDRKMYRNRNRN